MEQLFSLMVVFGIGMAANIRQFQKQERSFGKRNWKIMLIEIKRILESSGVFIGGLK